MTAVEAKRQSDLAIADLSAQLDEGSIESDVLEFTLKSIKGVAEKGKLSETFYVDKPCNLDIIEAKLREMGYFVDVQGGLIYEVSWS